jgi:hypothetical protein
MPLNSQMNTKHMISEKKNFKSLSNQFRRGDSQGNDKVTSILAILKVSIKYKLSKLVTYLSFR